MANVKNLKPIKKGELSSEEAKARGKNGGIASGQARREKATMKKTLEMLLDAKTKDGTTYRELATLGLLKGAIDGNASNYKTILETLGELLQPEESKARITIINTLPKGDDNESNN